MAAKVEDAFFVNVVDTDFNRENLGLTKKDWKTPFFMFFILLTTCAAYGYYKALVKYGYIKPTANRKYGRNFNNSNKSGGKNGGKSDKSGAGSKKGGGKNSDSKKDTPKETKKEQKSTAPVVDSKKTEKKEQAPTTGITM